MKIKNKFDIGDTNIFIIRDQERGVKELVISNKTIYINTYEIKVLDVAVEAEQSLIFKHEGFQLWESESAGFLTQKNSDFVLINRDGINVIALGDQEKRELRDAEGRDRMMHSLASVNYLKVDPGNFLHFASAKMDKREIQVKQEFT